MSQSIGNAWCHGIYFDAIPQAFCIYMIVVAFAYFLFLYIDIRIHVNRAKEAIRDRELRRQILEEHINKLNVIWLMTA